jgi:hypothetical protein
MKRFKTTGIALVLSLAALTGANAASLNTTPLNTFGKPVSSTPVTYGLPNTTINSSIHPAVVPNSVYSQPNTTINSSIHPVVVPNSIYGQPNTTINSSIHPFVVPNSIYSRPNTTISSSLNVSKTPVTSGAGLQAITYGSFSLPRIAASIPTGTPNAPSRSSGYYALYGNGGDLPDTAPPGTSGSPTTLMSNAFTNPTMQSVTESQNAATINAQLQVQNQQLATQQSAVLSATPTLQTQQDTTTNNARTSNKSFESSNVFTLGY